jgi:ribosomal protein S7
MSRRRAAEKRQVLPDPIYNSVVLNKFINEVMVGGKKKQLHKKLYTVLSILLKLIIKAMIRLSIFKNLLIMLNHQLK